MGDPRKTRKKYSKPRHPWQKIRIEKDKLISKKYGLKNKQEIWKAASELKRYTAQAKRLIGLKNEQSDKEKKQLLQRLHKYGLANPDSKVEEVLNLTIDHILDRRLQTVVYKRGLARSAKQARQFIVHGHVALGGKRISVPSYMVTNSDVDSISIDPLSSLAKEDHPERVPLKKEKKKDDVEIDVEMKVKQAELKVEEEKSIEAL